MSELPDLELADRASSQWSLDWPKVEPACAEGEEGSERCASGPSAPSANAFLAVA